MTTAIRATIVGLALAVSFLPTAADAAPPHPAGRRGPMRNDPQFRADRAVFHFLLTHRDQIDRQVENLPNGIRTKTESDDEAVVEKIWEHVDSMIVRVEEGRPIHVRDPLFAELFRHADKIEVDVKHTDHGVVVTETSDDPYVAKLLHEHARVVSLFIERGHEEVRRNHALPERPSDDEAPAE